jgi:monoterpene epsilon-lactone hydrolase
MMADRGIAAVRKHLAKLPPADSLTFDEQRAQYDRAEKAFPVSPAVRVEPLCAPVAPAEWLRPSSARDDAVVLYLHGGGYVIGSPRSHRHLAGAIASAAGMVALLLDYRRAPECPFPAALDDTLAAYHWLLDTGFSPERVVIAGDSAGGGLTIATLVALRDAGLPRVAAGVCISPWVDLTCSSGSYATKAASDPVVRAAGVAAMARAYLGETDARAPLVSPLYADLRGLPPLLIHVGSEEILLDDAVALAERAKAAGVDATLEVWDQMVHVWHWFLPMLDEAQAAIDRIGEFIGSRVSGSPRAT